MHPGIGAVGRHGNNPHSHYERARRVPDYQARRSAGLRPMVARRRRLGSEGNSQLQAELHRQWRANRSPVHLANWPLRPVSRPGLSAGVQPCRSRRHATAIRARNAASPYTCSTGPYPRADAGRRLTGLGAVQADRLVVGEAEPGPGQMGDGFRPVFGHDERAARLERVQQAQPASPPGQVAVGADLDIPGSRWLSRPPPAAVRCRTGRGGH